MVIPKYKDNAVIGSLYFNRKGSLGVLSRLRRDDVSRIWTVQDALRKTPIRGANMLALYLQPAECRTGCWHDPESRTLTVSYVCRHVKSVTLVRKSHSNVDEVLLLGVCNPQLPFRIVQYRLGVHVAKPEPYHIHSQKASISVSIKRTRSELCRPFALCSSEHQYF